MIPFKANKDLQKEGIFSILFNTTSSAAHLIPVPVPDSQHGLVSLFQYWTEQMLDSPAFRPLNKTFKRLACFEF